MNPTMNRHQHADDGERDVVGDGLAGDRVAEHRDEVHGPDPGGSDGDRRQRQPQRPVAARVDPGPGQAAQPDEGAQARHEVAQHRVEQAIREVLNMHGRHGCSPHKVNFLAKDSTACLVLGSQRNTPAAADQREWTAAARPPLDASGAGP